SGNGKSTFLMVMNRLWEGILGARLEGRVSILIDNTYRDIYSGSIGLSDLRRKVGMVFQTPNPLPMSIVKNVSFPLKLMGCKDKKKIVEKTEQSLRQAYLWNEVKDRLDDDAGSLSGGQQQRLCIARALILEPEVILLDEPTSSLDKTASAVIEELLIQLKKRCTILMVSHYLDQVKRIADNVFEFSEGKFIRL
ncbi:MAG: phosphate ABC transporter ATP-binding protein, partial [Deltaproteobacteria bacterium]|nr:phosphate ABC transporter ATP-binding protein [Deltaproteobacteria bacterium]